MKNNTHTILAAILIILLLLILNPFGFWMPTMAHMLVLGGTFVVFALFAVFIFRERGGDEREDAHRMLAGRIAFLVGSTALTCGILFQEYRGELDPWLIFSLVLMILAKIGSRIWSDRAL